MIDTHLSQNMKSVNIELLSLLQNLFQNEYNLFKNDMLLTQINEYRKHIGLYKTYSEITPQNKSLGILIILLSIYFVPLPTQNNKKL